MKYYVNVGVGKKFGFNSKSVSKIENKVCPMPVSEKKDIFIHIEVESNFGIWILSSVRTHQIVLIRKVEFGRTDGKSG